MKRGGSPLSLYTSYWYALSGRDPVYHILELPNAQELCLVFVKILSQPKRKRRKIVVMN